MGRRMKLKLRQIITGVALSLVVTGLIYFVPVFIQNRLNNNANVLQYHDSYFVVVHLGWMDYSACFLAALFIYFAGLMIYRKRARKSG